MQPGTNPDDLRNILSRFHTWAEKDGVSSNGNGHKNGAGSEGVREIPYEEAIRPYRKRRTAQNGRAAVSAIATASSESTMKLQAAPAIQEAPLDLPPEGGDKAKTEETPLPLGIALDPHAGRGALAAKTSEPDARQKTTPRARTAKPAPKSAAVPRVVQVSPPAEVSAASAAVHLAPSPAVQASPQTEQRSVRAAEKLSIQPSEREKRASAPTGRAAYSKPPTKTGRPPATATQAAHPGASSRRKKHPPFRQVLANTVQAKPVQAKPVRAKAVRPAKPSLAKKQAAPDRSRRITTRFSTAEERRIEKQAAQVGLTVSAWLRQCALSQAETEPRSERLKSRRAAELPARPPTLFSQPTGLGSWLTLLRQRFLASPERFAERA